MNVFLGLLALTLAGEPPLTTTAVLQPGSEPALRIRQVIPADGLSPGERLLNSLPPLQVGDGFLAEVVAPPGQPTVLVAGTVAALKAPGYFGRPGQLTLELDQFAPLPGAAPATQRWVVTDQRYLSPRKRRLLTTLLALEGVGMGASVAAQFQPVKSVWVGTGAAIGLVTGLAFASCLPGRAATLEPGDTFRVSIGRVEVHPLPPELPFQLYPAQEPAARKGKP